MLPCTLTGSNVPTVLSMPILGGSQSEWTEVVEELSPDFKFIASDLPKAQHLRDVAAAVASRLIDDGDDLPVPLKLRETCRRG